MVERDEKGRLLPGQKLALGNKGRSPVPDWFVSGYSEKAFRCLADILDDKTDADIDLKQKTALEVINRCCGRVREGSAPPPPVDSVTVEQLESVLAARALDGDRSAILALLAARDPARYGRGDRPSTDDASADTDVPAWTPRVDSP